MRSMNRWRRARSSRVSRPPSPECSNAAGRAVVVAISSPFSAASGSPRTCRSLVARLAGSPLGVRSDQWYPRFWTARQRRNLACVATAERFWTRRLRWRLLGAWRWPAFAVLTVVDAALLHEVGTGVRFNWPVSLILASFANIALLSAADALARLAARNRAAQGVQDPHLEVTIDRG